MNPSDFWALPKNHLPFGKGGLGEGKPDGFLSWGKRVVGTKPLAPLPKGGSAERRWGIDKKENSFFEYTRRHCYAFRYLQYSGGGGV